MRPQLVNGLFRSNPGEVRGPKGVAGQARSYSRHIATSEDVSGTLMKDAVRQNAAGRKVRQRTFHNRTARTEGAGKTSPRCGVAKGAGKFPYWA